MRANLIGTEVIVDPYTSLRLDVAVKHRGRSGVITAGPEVQFGTRKYRVLLELRGRETVPEEIWLPANILRKKKDAI